MSRDSEKNGELKDAGQESAAVKNDFSKGSIIKTILTQAVPLMFANIVAVLYNIVDRIYLGHIQGAGTLALTGVGVAFPVITIITAFTDWFGKGGVPLCSIARGARREKEAKRILGTTAWLLTVTAAVVLIAGYLFERPILYAFGASDETYRYAREYLTIYLSGTFFFVLGHGLIGFIHSQGFPRYGMFATVLGAVLNIILDPIFIFSFGMGVYGAAVATVISQFATFLMVMIFLLGKKAIIPLQGEFFRFNPRVANDIVTLGFSGFIMSGTNGLVQIACNVMLSIYGGDLYIGIMTILTSIRETIQLPGKSVSDASQPVYGFNYGAKEFGRVKESIVFTTLCSGAYSLLAWLVIILFPSNLIRIFTSDMQTIELGVLACRVYFAGFLWMVLQFCAQGVFVSLKYTRHAIFFSIFRKVIIVVPLTLILPRVGGLGVYGVFLAEPISNIIGGTAAYTAMYRRVYRSL